MIDNLLLELVRLPSVLALAVHQVYILGWMDHSWYLATLLLKVRVD